MDRLRPGVDEATPIPGFFAQEGTNSPTKLGDSTASGLIKPARGEVLSRRTVVAGGARLIGSADPARRYRSWISHQVSCCVKRPHIVGCSSVCAHRVSGSNGGAGVDEDEGHIGNLTSVRLRVWGVADKSLGMSGVSVISGFIDLNSAY